MVEERDGDALQEVVDQAPAAGRYFSDGFHVYPTLMYAPGAHAVAPGKSQTFSVEGGNADLRHYIARLGRRSRCFSRCIEALCSMSGGGNGDFSWLEGVAKVRVEDLRLILESLSRRLTGSHDLLYRIIDHYFKVNNHMQCFRVYDRASKIDMA